MRIHHAHGALRLAGALLLAAASATTPAQDPTRTDPEGAPQAVVELARDVQPFVRRYCIECHGAVDPESDLDLGALFQGPPEGDDDLDGLYAVRDALRTADMPPRDEPQPDPAERTRIVEWLDRLLATAAGDLEVRPGRVTMRRLSRYEYRNTIRDLLGVEVEVDSFPADDLGYGFDNVGDALSLSTIHLEKYAAAAERIAAEAFPDPDPAEPATLLVEGDRLEASNDDFLRGGVAGMFTNGWAGGRLRLPRAGRYQLRVLAWAQQAGPDVARMRVEVGTPGDGRPFASEEFEVAATEADPGRFAVDLEAPTDRLQVRAHFTNDYYDPDHRDPTQRDRNLYVGAIELVGPLDRRPATLAERRFGSEDSGRGLPAVRARKVLEPLLERAWRRPVSSSEVRRFSGLVADVAREVERQAGGAQVDPYREGLRWAVQAALCSPHFLFRIESGGLAGRDEQGASESLGPWQLATRLSYFLWSSLPDDELRARAADGSLTDPRELERQARRMLADPRAEALATHFAAQWLELRGLDEVEPDPRRFPDFSGSLAASMRRETELLFDHVRRADRPVQELLTADYSFVDATLARLYGLDGVPDDGAFHRVDLRRTTRGGILGHASVLTVTSIPTRTSPVKRGKWILDNLLGDAPPPPPPGNDAFAAGEAAVTTSQSLREQLAIHRQKAECAVCHDRMDALGLALERFDGIGRYRTGDDGGTILVASELPGGKLLDGLRGVREHLATDRAFAANLMAKLFVYATGRAFRVTDALVVDSTLSALGADPTLDELLLAIVRLEAFRSRDLVALLNLHPATETMAQPIRQLHLSRRGFLRGSGACLALPWLDAMAPALGRAPCAEPGVLFVFSPNGMKMDEWRPDGDGPRAKLPYLLEPLRPVRDQLTVISGLAIDAGFAHGDGPGDHARAASTFLTCAHPVKTGGADIRVGQSIDQAIAERIGEQSTFRSLEFGMEGGRSAGVCDSGYSCAYSNNVSWRTETTPVAKETDPRRLFERLFGDPEQHADLAAQASRRARLRSVLDLAADDLKGLRKKLGPADQQKLDEYADAVRDVEGRLSRIESDEADALESVPGDLLERHRDAGFAGQLDLAYELLGLALRTGRTRVISFMLGNGGSNRSYRFLGAAEGHHSLSHHRGDPEKLDGIRRINRFHMERFGRFLENLQAMQHADGTLLDHTAVVFGSGISDGNRHNHDDLPVLVAGRAAGRLRPRGHLKVADHTPMANLYLSVAGAVGAEMPNFADSTGRLSEVL